ncbi:beta subunit of citrate lyase [Dendrothele bispora CBS 962.96]|uniref:Beta subunit of citrate lyase n=1 Tax=Dendrothele bispora (strain CBS 962.96) TaxID=1314807 RepID=A0A4S8MFJ3_DENBC|nr:beta subunit of citrate lyase [Dendrothele bispora CBS 962.96]
MTSALTPSGTLRKSLSLPARARRKYTTSAGSLRRSYLYVPCSSDKLLEKSLSVNSDIIIYDLEDSVSPVPKDKEDARNRLQTFLKRPDIPNSERIAIRVNDISTPFFKDDVDQILRSSSVRTLILPKIHSGEDLDYVSSSISTPISISEREKPLRIVPSIESARALWNLGGIAGWKTKQLPLNGGVLSALLFAAEDYCADTSILRTRSRQELLYTRSQIAIAAKAFGLESVDMVCVHYKDLDYLKEECEDGRRLGFSGKQAIHPSQVDTIQSTFVPTEKEILRAAKILYQMKDAHASQKGAIGLEGEMIDAPMIKQAEKIVAIAKAAQLKIPTFD